MCAGIYLIVYSDLRVGISLIERFDLTDVVLQRKLHHSEHHWHLCWQLGELQLTAVGREKRTKKTTKQRKKKTGKRKTNRKGSKKERKKWVQKGESKEGYRKKSK